MVLLIIGVLALVVAVVAIGAVQRRQRVTFVFADKDDHLLLTIEGPLAFDETGLMSMRALREALRLKLAMGYGRLLVDLRGLAVGDMASFWIAVGGLGPALVTESARVALVCRPRTRTHQRFRDGGFVDVFLFPAEALERLRSQDPPHPVTLDAGWVDTLLFAKRPQPPPARRAA